MVAKEKMPEAAAVLQLGQLLLSLPRLYFAMEANGLATEQGTHPEKLVTEEPEKLVAFLAAAADTVVHLNLLILDIPLLQGQITLATGFTRTTIASFALGAKSFAVVLTAFTSGLYLAQAPNPLKAFILVLETTAGLIIAAILLDIWQIARTGSGFLTPSLKFKVLVVVAAIKAIQGMIMIALEAL